MGCKGPTTYNACSTMRWNGGVSFPIQSGHGCIGCSEDGFWDKGSFYDRVTDINAFGVESNADKVGKAPPAWWARRWPPMPRSAASSARKKPATTEEQRRKHDGCLRNPGLQARQLRQARRRRSGLPHRGPPAGRGEPRHNNVIRNAVSTGTMWRGLEVILKGRDPRDAWAFTERICGVCTGTHALTSVRAVEDALAIKIPRTPTASATSCS
jgi:hypothetical protein